MIMNDQFTTDSSKRGSLTHRCCHFLSLILFLVLLTPYASFAQLKEPKAPQPSVEEQVDQVFGKIVGTMASVLLWDVVFWDNERPLSSRVKAPATGSVITDPLGWELWQLNKGKVDAYDLHGQFVRSYHKEGVDVQDAWLVDAGRLLLARSSQNELWLFRRSSAKAPAGPFSLPNGTWTSFAEVKGMYLFGNDQGELFEAQFRDDKVEWVQHDLKLNAAVALISVQSSKSDYIAFTSIRSETLIAQIHQPKAVDDPKEADQGADQGAGQESNPPSVTSDEDSQASQTEQPQAQTKQVILEEVLRLSPLSPIEGKANQHGFISGQFWTLSQNEASSSLSVWSTKTGQMIFSLKLPLVQAITSVVIGQDQHAFLTIHQKQGAHLTSSQGEEISLKNIFKLDDQHPLLKQTTHAANVIQGALWISHPGVIYQATQPSGEVIMTPSLFATQGSLRPLLRSGHHLVTQGSTHHQLWDQPNLQLPLIVLWLVLGALFFTFRMRFVNLRLFRHAIDVVRGKYTDPNSVGEVSHFQALTSALSATVGLGNIAGVAIAVSLGGPGATFWMIVAGFLGMASKFTECTLGQKYRTISPSGEVMGGAMHYLSKGLGTERNLPRFGKLLAVLFSFLCIGGSFGGGNAFQVKQSLEAVAEVIPALNDANWIYGLVMAAAVGVVILGGIKSIAQTAEKIVPAMCGLYILASLYIILVNASAVPEAIMTIISGAFAPDALYGGAVGVLVVGFKRAAFSNEAGIGSAAIAHAAAKTEYPIREGVVALLEPFIDTIIVCTMTALVIVITGAYQNPEYGALIAGNKGAALTSQAMGEVISFFPYVLSVAVVLFAYSTMISWSYYGERCWAWLFGENPALFSLGSKASLIYRILFLLFAFLGSIVTATNILDFSDLMILGMALPNILGLLFLTRGVRADLDEYETKLHAGDFPIFDLHAQEDDDQDDDQDDEEDRSTNTQDESLTE